VGLASELQKKYTNFQKAVDKSVGMVYNINIKRVQPTGGCPHIQSLFRITAYLDLGGYFFLFIILINSVRATRKATASPISIISNTSSMLSTSD
jgi:hypothetical protein